MKFQLSLQFLFLVCFLSTLAKRRPDADLHDLSIDFNCDTSHKSTSEPTNIHFLRPADVDVIGAVGDSITAGNGISLDVALERRGQSWSVGAAESLDSGTYTLATILQKFNPDLKGYSSGAGPINIASTWLNRAIPGATARKLPAQTDDLILKMKQDNRIDIANDWKVFTYFIGGNDLCGYCKNRDVYSPTEYRNHLRDSLDKLLVESPRTLVNLVPMFDVTPLKEMSRNPLCDIMHIRFCECAINETTVGELRPVQLEYYNLLKDLIDSGRYDTTDDFTVVLQPMFRDMEPPRNENGDIDSSYLSTDCFHPNRKGHQTLAYMLWDSMLTPVGQKPLKPADDLDMDNLAFKCPTVERPYIFTKENSNVFYRLLPRYEPEESNGHGALIGGVVGGVVACASIATILTALFIRRRSNKLTDVQSPSAEEGSVDSASDQPSEGAISHM